MRHLLTKIWVPIVLVMAAALQSFGIDASRAVGLKRLTDSLIVNQLNDSTGLVLTEISQDSTINDSIATDSVTALILSPKDTIQVPDSLKETDPFKYKYYIAIKDSTVRF